MSSSTQNVKVGLFVFFLLIVMGGTLFLVSGSTKMFEERYYLNASWQDVAGLKEGSVVRLAGIDVGEVLLIQFQSGDEDKSKIHVTLSIEKRYQHRIRQCSHSTEFPWTEDDIIKKSSVARIDSIGVLGDKYVSINTGSIECTQLEQDQWIKTIEALDIISYTKKVTGILNNTNNISYKVNEILGTKEDVEAASLASSLQDLKEITHEIKTGNGLIHALVYDEKLTKKIDSTLSNLEKSSQDIQSAITEIKSGDGLAHELIYGNDGEKLAKDLQEVSRALNGLLNDIRNENSLIHSLIYDESKKTIIDDLAITADALKQTSQSITEGDGTMAMMLRDPALYEDLRSLVGGAQRNKLLRSYIRKTVEQNEVEKSQSWKEENKEVNKEEEEEEEK